MNFPKTLSAREAVRQVNEDHLEGWEQAEFQDPERIMGCDEFTLRSIDVPAGLEYSAGVGHHPPVVAEYRSSKGPPPPPFFDMNGQVIDGKHRLEANAGRTIAVYVPTDYRGPLYIGWPMISVLFAITE